MCNWINKRRNGSRQDIHGGGEREPKVTGQYEQIGLVLS